MPDKAIDNGAIELIAFRVHSLVGGIGDDLLLWDGADTLNGGAGLDTLRFASNGTLQFDST